MAEPQQFTVMLKRSPDYRIYPCQEIYGGPVPDGSGILMNICVDHYSFPNYISHPVDNGKVNLSVISDSASVGEVERELLCGVYLTVDEAKKAIGWLGKIVEALESRGKGE